MVAWTLLTNDVQAGKYRASFTIRNSGDQSLQDSWAIYFNQMTGTVVENSIDPGISLIRVTGDYWKMSPTSELKAIESGQEKTFEYEMNGNIFSVSYTPRGVYYVIGESGPKLADYQMAPFDLELFQSFNPPSPEIRFKQNQHPGSDLQRVP